MEPKFINIHLESTKEPLGFIEISEETTLKDARTVIESEIEDVPPDFRFVIINNGVGVRMSKIQESTKKAKDFGPTIFIRAFHGENSGSLIMPEPNLDSQIQLVNEPKSPKEPRKETSTESWRYIPILSPLELEKVWKIAFPNQNSSSVVLDQIPVAIYKIAIPGDYANIDTLSPEFRAITDLVVNMGPLAYGSSQGSTENPKEVFFRIIASFSPINGILERIVHFLKQSYFHGNLSSRDAETLVASYSIGTFILRLSNTQLGSFALTVNTHERPKHYAIERTPEGEYKLGKECELALENLLLKHSKKINLLYPCPKSPFTNTFKALATPDRYTEFTAEETMF